MKINQDKTDLYLTKQELEKRNKDLDLSKAEVNKKNIEITELKSIISKHQNTISDKDTIINQLNSSIVQKEETISALKNKIRNLENRPPKTITKYQDRTVYKTKPEPYHPYGKGYGQLTIYTLCSNGGATKIWVDGEFFGSLNYYKTGEVYCNSSGTISKPVLSGNHYIEAKDAANRTWKKHLVVTEDNCKIWGMSCQ